MLVGEILLRQGKVTPEQMASVLRQSDGEIAAPRLGELLVSHGYVSEEDVLKALGEQFDVNVLRNVDDRMLDPALVADLPVDWARSHRMLPIQTTDGAGLITSDPTQVEAQENLELILGCELTPYLVPADVVTRAIERCYFQKDDTARHFLERFPAATAEEGGPAVRQADDLLRVTDNAPVTQLVNLILLEAVKAGASDIHIEPYEEQLRVRYRVDGFLTEQTSPPKHLEASLISRLKVMGRLDIAEKRLPQDGMARVRVGEREIDIRVSTIPIAEGERVVLRLLNRESALLPLSELGMSAGVLQLFRSLLRSPSGVLLLTGPTGSGKTTTLYATLQELDTVHSNVLTIEDPIEYQLPQIGQIQVKPKIGLTFAHGLRHILRQDPDVILVGETRDVETAEIMVRASLTGHLVFSTLHTNDSASAAMRLADMGIAPYLLSASLKAVMAQRLVRVLDPQQKEETTLTEEEAKPLGRYARELEGVTLWKPRPSTDPTQGYKGRTGVYELLVVSESIQDAIRTGAGVNTLRQMAREEGMQTLMDDGIRKVRAGLTSVQELLRAVGGDPAQTDAS